MADDQQFCLRWNNFQTNFTSQFKALRIDEDFVDVTLACEGKRVKAHKLVLSACSPYFKELFKANPCKHPIIFMHDVEYEHLMGLVEFMYVGQVNICQAKLPDFLHTAEALQIRGLSAQSQNKLPQTTENGGELRPGPSLKESPRSADSPEPSTSDDGRGDESTFTPPLPSKRFCTPELLHSRESTSYSDVPTTQLIETKMEPMDYYSDSEVQPHIPHNSQPEHHSINRNSFSLQGALEAASNMTAQLTQLQESPQESVDLVSEMCKPHSMEGSVVATTTAGVATATGDSMKPHSLDPRPCPECGRIYSNISNLRQHIRLIHYPECITCPLCFKPFKNKLYLRRHVMSYHEINLPSQNDMRYKYANLMSTPASVNKDQDGFDPTKITPEIAKLFGPSKTSDVQRFSADKNIAEYAELRRYPTKTRPTVNNVPSKT